MLQSTDEAGLIVWGSKEGVEDFFWSPNIDFDDPEISTAMDRDIRSIINMPVVDVIFYSLGAIKDREVYTCYKTIHDATKRKYSFLAISLYVPDSIVFENGVWGLLNQLMNIYSSDYLDYNLIIKHGIREDKEMFFNVIDQASIRKLGKTPAKMEIHYPRTEFAYLLYSNPQDLGRLFNNIDQYEYQKCKLVFFFPNKEEGLYYKMPLLSLKGESAIVEAEHKNKSQAVREPIPETQNKITPHIEEKKYNQSPKRNIKKDTYTPGIKKEQSIEPFNSNEKTFFEKINVGYLYGFLGLLIVIAACLFISEVWKNSEKDDYRDFRSKKQETSKLIDDKIEALDSIIRDLKPPVSEIGIDASTVDPSEIAKMSINPDTLTRELILIEMKMESLDQSTNDRMKNLEKDMNSGMGVDEGNDTLESIKNNVLNSANSLDSLIVVLENDINITKNEVLAMLGDAAKRDAVEITKRNRARAEIKELTAFSKQSFHMQVEDIKVEIEKIKANKYSGFRGNEKSVIFGRLLELKEIHIASFIIRTKPMYSPERAVAKKVLEKKTRHITSDQKLYVKDLLGGKYNPAKNK